MRVFSLGSKVFGRGSGRRLSCVGIEEEGSEASEGLEFKVGRFEGLGFACGLVVLAHFHAGKDVVVNGKPRKL